MREIISPTKTEWVELECPKCKKGTLEFSGITLTSNPPWYSHKCSRCDYSTNILNKLYPYAKRTIDTKKGKKATVNLREFNATGDGEIKFEKDETITCAPAGDINVSTSTVKGEL